MRKSFPRIAEILQLIQVMLKERMSRASLERQPRLWAKEVFPPILGPMIVFGRGRSSASGREYCHPYLPCPNYGVLMFSDTSNAHWDCFLTLIPRSAYHSGIPVEYMTYQPSAVLSGTSKASHIRWSTIDEGGVAVVSSFCRTDYLVQGVVGILSDHRNVAYIFKQEVWDLSVSKALSE